MPTQDGGVDVVMHEVQGGGVTDEGGDAQQGGGGVLGRGKRYKMAAIPKRRRPSERIIKKKLSRNVVPKNGEGCSPNKPCQLE